MHARTLDEGSSRIEGLYDGLDLTHAAASEAETRFQIIDQLLSALGWPKSDIFVERFDDAHRTDYELGYPPRIVVEAKSVSKPWGFPAGVARTGRSDIPSLIKADETLGEAILQCQGYCSQRGIEISLVTNGFQLVAFLAARTDGIPPLKGKAIVVPTPGDIRSNFAALWNYLSPEGVNENNLRLKLKDGIEVAAEVRPRSHIVGYPCPLPQNGLQHDLEIVAHYLLLDLPERADFAKEFAEHCYVSSRSLRKFTMIGLDEIGSRYHRPEVPQLDTISMKQVRSLIEKTHVATLASRPIIIMGDIGVGKTAFLRNLMYRARPDDPETPLFVYVDLRIEASLMPPSTFISLQIQHELLSGSGIDINTDPFVREVYSEELIRFEQGVNGSLETISPERFAIEEARFLSKKLSNIEEHLLRSLHQLSLGRKVVIIIDNADLRSPDVQKEAMAAAARLAAVSGTTVFVSVRPETYSPSFFHDTPLTKSHIFTIEPPMAGDVIVKRLEFAMAAAKGDVGSGLTDVKLDLKQFLLLAKGVHNSLARFPHSSEAGAFFHCVGGGDLNWALRKCANYFGSANVSQGYVAGAVARNPLYMVSFQDIQRTVLCGPNLFFAEEPPLVNVFDVGSGSPSQHFVLPTILRYLLVTDARRDVFGFLPSLRLIEDVQRCGFTVQTIDQALQKGVASGLLSQRVDGLTALSKIRVEPLGIRMTSSGAYYIQNWIRSPAYLEAVWVDTPILLDEFARKLRNIDIRSPRDRFGAAEIFRDYLVDMWTQLPTRPAFFDWPAEVASGDQLFEQRRKAQGGRRNA